MNKARKWAENTYFEPSTYDGYPQHGFEDTENDADQVVCNVPLAVQNPNLFQRSRLAINRSRLWSICPLEFLEAFKRQ